MSNVRFYRVDVLPTFNNEKHVGIFVHVTVGDTTHKKGLWFGGATGWEYLTNDTTPESITNAINALDVEGYAQAGITTSTDSSTLTIKGIQEVDGKIGIPADNKNLDLNIAIDGVYNESTNKIATESTVINATNGLNAGTVQAVTFNTPENGGNTTLTFKGVKEANGVIAQGEGTSTFIVGDAKLKIQIGSTEDGTFEVFSANAQSDGAIKLNENVFQKGENNVISVITPTAVTSSNRLVTEQDIANLAGAMHYKGSIASYSQWPENENVKAGDVWIASGNFKNVNESIESGDLIVFNTNNNNSDYKVVQSNITLGIGNGQIAANVGDLTPNNMVIATSDGIKTIGITETQLTGADNNKRELSIDNGNADGDFHHDVTISDAFKVIGNDFTKTINISSTNRSIEIANKTVNGVDAGVVVDLVWNTSIE